MFSGTKTGIYIVEFCFSKAAKKSGILRKQCNSTGPTNTFRFVPSPSRGPKHTIYLPDEIFEKGEFMFSGRDGRYKSIKIKEGDAVVFGRCLSQGADSALLIWVGRTSSKTMRVPVDVCSKNNTDFDGDEDWGLQPGSEDGQQQVRDAISGVWDESESIFEQVGRLVSEAGGDELVDPVMYTTISIEYISEHPGGKIYELLMLKPSSQKVMSAIATNPTYQSIWVDRSLDGILNKITGKHGIGKLYVDMRYAMMLGTVISSSRGTFRIRCLNQPLIPAVTTDQSLAMSACSCALTKLTVDIYQKGIDIAKHSRTTSKIPAAAMLLTLSEQCYSITNVNGSLGVALVSASSAVAVHTPYTKMSYIANASTSESMLERALSVVCMVEEIDDIPLTNKERVALSVFLAFASTRTDEIISGDMIGVIKNIGADWYPSVIYSNISWIKSVLRSRFTNNLIDKTMSINSVLGSIFLRNMCNFAPLAALSDIVRGGA